MALFYDKQKVEDVSKAIEELKTPHEREEALKLYARIIGLDDVLRLPFYVGLRGMFLAAISAVVLGATGTVADPLTFMYMVSSLTIGSACILSMCLRPWREKCLASLRNDLARAEVRRIYNFLMHRIGDYFSPHTLALLRRE